MLTFGSHIDGYFDVADQMIDHLRRRAERAFRARDAERQSIKTVADFEAYRARMRENLLRAVGGLPKEKTPLNAQVTGTIERGEYAIEKIIYYSLPEFPVTATLYIPNAARKTPAAAVLFVCGHTMEGKSAPVYQKVCADLALDGFVVLAIDPLGQGERYQFIDEASGRQRVPWGTNEHTYAGIQFYAAGTSIARHFIWDDIRGLDYLLTRPEVDAQRIGVTGNSGGGLQTALLMMAEPRIAAAMPCTFIMDYESYVKSGQPQDGEQNLYASFIDGPDHDDYITAMAPKPVRLGLAAYDFFPIEGALKSFERAQGIYALFGNDAQRNLDYAIAPTTHTYGADLRKAAVNFFRRTLRGDAETFSRDADPDVLPVEALNSTQSGQVLQDFRGCKTVTQLLTQDLRERLPVTPRDFDAATVAGVLGIGEAVPAGEASWTGEARQRTIYPRIIENVIAEGYRTEKIFFFTEPDVCVTAIYIHPRDEARISGTEIVLFDEGTNAIPQEKPRLRHMLEAHKRVFVFDVRGVGGVKTRRMGSAEEYSRHGTEFRLAMDAMKLKTSTLGLRVFDVLRAVDYLKTRADAGPLSISGVGLAATWALYAAALETRIESVRLERPPISYRATVATRFYDDAIFNMRVTAFGLLSAGDISDMVKLIAPRVVRMTEVLTPEGTPVASGGSGAATSSAMAPGVKT